MSKKKLMNEALPDPKLSKAEAAPARQRVLSHMRKLVGAGAATATLIGCPPFGVVDPLPPPARCRTNNDVLSELMFNALRTDTGAIDLRITAKTDFESGVEISFISATSGGTIIDTPLSNTTALNVTVQPTGNQVVLALSVTCEGMMRNVRITIDVATLNVTRVEDRDGG